MICYGQSAKGNISKSIKASYTSCTLACPLMRFLYLCFGTILVQPMGGGGGVTLLFSVYIGWADTFGSKLSTFFWCVCVGGGGGQFDYCMEYFLKPNVLHNIGVCSVMKFTVLGPTQLRLNMIGKGHNRNIFKGFIKHQVLFGVILEIPDNFLGDLSD